ncbi:MAG: histidine phosphatase family protein [Acidimicrobiales bacterium]|jgi:probable phosphoglycerate mutase
MTVASEWQSAPQGRVAAGTRLVIVRHGEAVSNAEDLVAGHLGCSGLTERGRLQVRALAERLRRTGELEGATALYSSVLRRAVETAEILLPVLGDVSYEARCALCERHPGEADGLSWAECDRRYGRRLPGDDPERPLSPGGENWLEFLDRAEDALYRLAQAHPGELVVVSGHGGVVDASLIRFLGLPEHGGLARFFPDNASMTEWAFTGTRWWLVRYNDAAHLDPSRPHDPAGLRIAAPAWVQREQTARAALARTGRAVPQQA